MEIVTVPAGTADAGVQTGGERTLQSQTKPDAKGDKGKVKMPEDAELETRRQTILSSMGWGAPPEVPAKTPETKVEEPPAPAEPAPAPAAPAVVAPAAPAAPVVSDQDALIAKTAKAIGQEVGDKVAEAVKDSRPAAPEPAKEAVPTLTPEDEQAYAIAKKMEALKTAPAGTAEALRAFFFKRYDYESEWLKNNPGQEFDPKDPAHDDFYKAQPEVDDDAYEAARIEMLVDSRFDARIETEVKPVLNRMTAEKALESARPVIAKSVGNRIVEAVTMVSEELGKILVVDGNISLNKETIDKLTDSDPIAARVLDPIIVNELRPMVVALEMSILPGQPQLNPRDNALHAEIAKYVTKFESDLSSGPESGRVRDGRQFLTTSQYNHRIENITGSSMPQAMKEQKLKELHDAHWTASIDDIQAVIVRELSARAKREIDELDGVAKKKYGKAAPASASPPVAQPEPPQPAPPPTPPQRNRPPAINSAPTPVDTSVPGAAKNKTFGETAVESHWRR